MGHVNRFWRTSLSLHILVGGPRRTSYCPALGVQAAGTQVLAYVIDVRSWHTGYWLTSLGVQVIDVQVLTYILLLGVLAYRLLHTCGVIQVTGYRSWHTDYLFTGLEVHTLEYRSWLCYYHLPFSLVQYVS